MEKLKIVNNMNNANAITHNGKFHVDECFHGFINEGF